LNSESTYKDPNFSLVDRCKKGDEKAYSELYRLYAKAMLNTSMRIVNSKDEAEDVLQESFLKAFQNIRGFDGKTSFGSWLKRIVINRSIDIIRKKKPDFISLDEAVHIESEQMEEGKFGYDIGIVRNCMQELPDGFRVVLTLYLVEDFSHREIAQMLNINEGTSRSQYNRAKKKLMELVKSKTVSHERSI